MGLFASIISGESPSYKIYEDEYTFAFLAKEAIHLGHTLIVPKIEVDYFLDVPEPYYSAVFKSAKLIGGAIHRATGCKRVGTVIAGWDVPHFHYHLIPMFDYYDLDPRKAKKFASADNIEVQSKIVQELNFAIGCDVSLLEYNLSLTPDERVEHHQRALELLNEVLKARRELYGESKSSPETAP